MSAHGWLQDLRDRIAANIRGRPSNTRGEPRKSSAVGELIGALLLSLYALATALIGIGTFLVAWVYAIDKYGIFLGVGLGVFPSLVIGALAGLLWPVAALIWLKWPDTIVRVIEWSNR